MSFLFYPNEANVVLNVLIRLPMGRVSYVKEDKKELVHDVHGLDWLVVRLVDSDEGGVIVHNGSWLSFVWDVKFK